MQPKIYMQNMTSQKKKYKFLVPSKPLQTKNQCLPTHIAIHFASLFINSKFKIAMYTVIAIKSWLFLVLFYPDRTEKGWPYYSH